MIKRSYKRFEGITSETHSNITIERYTTATVTYVYPRHVEVIERYLLMFYPDVFKYILVYNPVHTPSVGVWLEYDDKGHYVTLKSACAPKISYDNFDIKMSIKTPTMMRRALKTIVMNVEWYINR